MENKITVCVADADQAYRTELCDFLKKQGDICLIGDTADGREALAMVEAQHPAVLVLDTVLPGLDGTGILRRLKGKSETRCIVVTEFRTAEAARDIRDAGAYVFLPKPADDTSVLEHIRHAAGPRCDLPLQQLGDDGHGHHPRDRRAGAHQGLPVPAGRHYPDGTEPWRSSTR